MVARHLRALDQQAGVTQQVVPADGLGHEAAALAEAHDEPGVGEVAQGPLHGDARDPELLAELDLGGDPGARPPLSVTDACLKRLADPHMEQEVTF